MAIETILRGSTVYFAARFVDGDGLPAVPSGATLHLRYPSAGLPDNSPPIARHGDVKQSIAMDPPVGGSPVVDESDAFTITWDSIVAVAGGRVYWTVITEGSWHAVAEGEFNLTGNRATQELEAA